MNSTSLPDLRITAGQPSMSTFRSQHFEDIIQRNLQDNFADQLSPPDLISFFSRLEYPYANFPSYTYFFDQVTVQHGDASSNSIRSPNVIQFFVRMMSGGKNLVLHGKPEDRVYSIHEKIQSLTGIPVAEQRLIYGNKRLEWEQSLSECMISNDSGLHLVGRMRSCWHPEAWQLIDELISAICRLCKGELGISSNLVKKKLMDFVTLIPKNNVGLAASLISIFTSSSVPEALVILHISPNQGIKECAEDSIQRFINTITFSLPQPISSQIVPILLELCKLLRRAAGNDDHLYKFCRNCLTFIVKNARNFHGGSNNRCLISLQYTFPFASELVSKISEGLISSMDSINNSGPLPSDVHEFMAFLRPLKAAVKHQLTLPVPIPSSCKFVNQTYKVKFLYILFDDFLTILLMCLDTMEDSVKEKKENGGWNQYLILLKELHDISKLYEGAENYFWSNLRDNKLSLCHLIVRYAKRDEDYEWILEHKDLLNFESRWYLVMLLLPEVDDDYDDLHEMLIDRSQLLVESFEYIAHAEPDCLRAGLFMEFKNEEATGPGVLREWFVLVCQEIFNPQNGLFIACPNDRRRFFPNPASKVDPRHLEYYNFAGRIIALALMRNIQVGIAFDRSFLLQLAGNNVSLEDIRDADPYLYTSCHQILEMDPMEIDQDALGLTFVWDIQELGSMKVTELCSGGKNMIVNSRNRKEYVDLLIKYRFMTYVSERINHFAQGFTDIVGEERIQKMCFKSLKLEDFDGMLFGSESDIDVEDWKKHTNYHGYVKTDPQIRWFWKIVEKMTAQERMVLLFFWTSMKYLPVEGFCALPSRLYIYKSNESINHLPSSHTCFYRICIPAYPFMLVMQKRLNVITQDHVGYSFGTI